MVRQREVTVTLPADRVMLELFVDAEATLILGLGELAMNEQIPELRATYAALREVFSVADRAFVVMPRAVPERTWGDVIADALNDDKGDDVDHDR